MKVEDIKIGNKYKIDNFDGTFTYGIVVGIWSGDLQNENSIYKGNQFYAIFKLEKGFFNPEKNIYIQNEIVHCSNLMEMWNEK